MAEARDARDTIAAVATPPGRGGIGVLRLSGPEALRCARLLLPLKTPSLTPSRARLTPLIDPETGVRLDEAIVTYFKEPRSYTGEDVVEIAAHGSPVLLDHLLRLLLGAGARLAAPGEFTERAFLSGRLDLTQAEAVHDLIDSQTLLQAQVAAQQLGGSLSRVISPLKQELVALIAVLEAGIDFAEDDTPVLSSWQLSNRLQTIGSALGELEGSFARGRLLSEGATLALVGRPNAGKSSLFNQLLGRERAIVTAEPGTTRDPVQDRLSLGGVPVELIDTAGLREGAGEAERMGIAKSRETLADAGLVLLVLDSTEALNGEEEALLRAAAGRRLLVALNKTDLLSDALPGAQPSERFDTTLLRQIEAWAPGAKIVPTSARTGQGVPELRAAMERLLTGTHSVVPESAMLTNLRQHAAVSAAREALAAASAAVGAATPHEMLLLDLYTGLRELDTLTGATTSDDVLALIFSTFCIGK